MESIVNATDIKPNFDELKVIWSKMLAKFFDSTGRLKPEVSQEVACPFCKSNSFHNGFDLNGFTHVECRECQSLYVTPRLKDGCVEELYSDDYYSSFYSNSMLPAFELRKESIGMNKYRQIRGLVDVSKGRILDIGGGIGEVIDVFKDNGWKTHVTEMNKTAYEWLCTRGHSEVFRGTFDDYKSQGQFDVIMAWGVVEHVLNPHEFLLRVRRLLKPGGVFVSEVPHGNCLLVDYARRTGKDPERILMGEQHIVLYSKSAYEQLHKNAGFELLHIQTNGLDFSTILKINKQKVDDHVILEVQKVLDQRFYGDLLRGYWHAKLE